MLVIVVLVLALVLMMVSLAVLVLVTVALDYVFYFEFIFVSVYMVGPLDRRLCSWFRMSFGCLLTLRCYLFIQSSSTHLSTNGAMFRYARASNKFGCLFLIIPFYPYASPPPITPLPPLSSSSMVLPTTTVHKRITPAPLSASPYPATVSSSPQMRVIDCAHGAELPTPLAD